jgi:hypothetical protein
LSVSHVRSQHVRASAHPLHIDIPVKLTDVKMVFSTLSFEGDLPASIFHMPLCPPQSLRRQLSSV